MFRSKATKQKYMAQNRRILEAYISSRGSAAAAAAPEPEGGESDDDVPGGKIYKNGDVLIGEHTVRRNLVRCELRRFVVQSETFLNKSVMLYGPSKTGKSHLTKYCMAESRTVFPNVVVVCPTAEDTGDYAGKVPEPLIHDKVENSKIAQIYQRQKASAKIFKMVNNPDALIGLFRRVATEREAGMLTAIDAAQREALARAGADAHAVTAEYVAKRVNIMRVVICNGAERLAGDPGLSDMDRTVLRYINFNPRMMIVFDDAMTEIEKCLKAKDDSIKEFFFKGRHAYITHFYLFQDDSRLPPDLRKNSFYSIFTGPGVARMFFQRPTNGFDKEQQDYAEAAIRTVFSSENNARHYKLLYDRMENEFFYITAGPQTDFRMCSEAVWKLCEASTRGADAIDTSNPFARRFAGRKK